ncbi:MAG: DNA polymerase III subunit beta [Bacteroidales bacterium]|nr:DNA polymerase III subunit beta [Bacteroidales bacterium]
MKFIISSTVLLKNLQLIYGVINPSNTLPILDDFKFELTGQSLEITASDLETTMKVSVQPDMAEGPGIIAIPAKLLMDTMKTMTNVPVTITIDEKTLVVEISAGEGKYKLSGHNADEFPAVPVIENPSSISVSSGLLANAFAHTLFATGNDELRPVMSGVFCELNNDDLTFVATDAHKLVRYRRTDARSGQATSFVLPKKPLNQLKNILPDDEPVSLEFNQTNAHFTFENVQLTCRLIEGKYPNYEAVIPRDNKNILTIEKTPFINAIRRVALYANQSTNQLRLRIAGQELTLSAEDIDFSNEAKERLSCSFEGEDMEIGFSSKFLLEMLGNIPTEQVRLELSTPNRAGLLVPVENENKDEDILMLIMPVMLNQ